MIERLSLADLRAVANRLSATGVLRSDGGMVTVAVHPSGWADIVAAAARWRWKAEWRRRRLARKGIVESLPFAEVGVIRGMRMTADR